MLPQRPPPSVDSVYPLRVWSRVSTRTAGTIMARGINQLTDADIKAAKPRETPYKLSDGAGLHLLVTEAGSRLWRLRYRRLSGAENMVGLGEYPTITLKMARKRRDDARRLIADGSDPVAERRAERHAARAAGENTFAAVAERWFEAFQKKGTKHGPLSNATIVKTQWLLNLDAYREKAEAPHPLQALGARPIKAITKNDIATVLATLTRHGKIETARRMLDRLGRVFRYASGKGLVTHNPATDFRDSKDEDESIPALTVRHHPAITEPRKLGELLRAIDGFEGQPTTEAAMKLAPLLFVRPGELRAAHWSEFNLEGKEPAWRIPASRTKMRREHIVPLAPQAVSILKKLSALTGPDGLVFPSLTSRARPLSENAITAALRRMGYDGDTMTWHGFRTVASTRLRELGRDRVHIELQLGHRIGSSTEQAYDQSDLLPERRALMLFWADYLDELKGSKKAAAPKGRKAKK